MLMSVLWPALTDWLGAAGAGMVPPVDVEGTLALSLRSGVVSVASAVVTLWLLFTSSRPRLGREAGILGVMVHVLHAGWEGWAIAPVAKRAELSERPALLRAASAPPGRPPPRILRSPVLDADIAPDRQAAVRHQTLYLDSVGLFGFAAVPGFEGWRSREFAALWARAPAVPLDAFLTLYGIEYVALPSELKARLFPGGLPPQGTVAELVLGSASDGSREELRWALVHTEGVRPRAFVAPRWRWASPDDAIDAVFTGSHARDSSLIVLTGAGAPSPVDRDGLALSPCRIEAYVPEWVQLDCDSPAGGYAVLADENAPGWTARLDAQPVSLLTADILLRAVAIPGGRHRVDFNYRTPQLRVGIAVSVVSWAALLVFFWRRRDARRGRPPDGPGSSSTATHLAP
jgi:hypothetical protein